MTTPTHPGSLRTRKRDATRVALCDAAFSVVRDAGVEGLTADAVAERAGVSRRTLFNYFPSVEAVLTTSVDDFFASVGERLESRPLDEPLLDSVRSVVSEPGDEQLVSRIAVLASAGEASPQARGLILIHLHGWIEWLEGWLRGRLGPEPSDLVVATLASALVGVTEAAWRVWWREQTSDPTDRADRADRTANESRSLAASFDAAIDLLRDGLDPGILSTRSSRATNEHAPSAHRAPPT